MNRLHRAIAYYRQGTCGRWKAALVASRLGHGQLGPLSEELAITVRAARDLRAAGYAYRVLRKSSSVLGEWAVTLGIYHFARIGYYLQDEKITPYEAIEELRIAFQSRSTIIEFNEAMRNVYSNDETDQWRGWLDKAHKIAAKLQDAYGAPEPIRQAAKEFVRVYERWREAA